MITSIISKPFNGFASFVDSANQLEDKVKNLAEKAFSSIKSIAMVKKGNREIIALDIIPLRIGKFVKENKFNLALATLSIAISAVVFVNVSAAAAILFLGAVSFVKAIAYTSEYVKSTDYQFKKLGKDYLKSIEAICRNFKDDMHSFNNAIQLSNNLETSTVYTKFYDSQFDLITFLLNNAKSYNQIESWKKYLKEKSQNLLIFNNSFPKYERWKTINTAAFEYTTTLDSSIKIRDSVTATPGNTYIDQVFIYVINKEKNRFKDELKSLVRENNPRSSSLKKDILNESKNIKSFLLNSTKKEAALEVYQEIIPPSLTNRIQNLTYKPFGFIKNLFLRRSSGYRVRQRALPDFKKLH